MDGSVELKPIYGPGFEAAIDREIVRQAGELKETRETNKKNRIMEPIKRLSLSDITDYQWIKEPEKVVGKVIKGIVASRWGDLVVLVFDDRSFMTVAYEDGHYNFGNYVDMTDILDNVYDLLKSTGGAMEPRFTQLADLLEVDRERVRKFAADSYERETSEAKRLEYEQYQRLKEKYEGPGRS